MKNYDLAFHGSKQNVKFNSYDKNVHMCPIALKKKERKRKRKVALNLLISFRVALFPATTARKDRQNCVKRAPPTALNRNDCLLMAREIYTVINPEKETVIRGWKLIKFSNGLLCELIAMKEKKKNGKKGKNGNPGGSPANIQSSIKTFRFSFVTFINRCWCYYILVRCSPKLLHDRSATLTLPRYSLQIFMQRRERVARTVVHVFSSLELFFFFFFYQRKQMKWRQALFVWSFFEK